ESLLNLKQGDESKKFQETVQSLLGSVPRLDSWLEQFYRARSKIVHEGIWTHLMFYPVDRKRYSDILKSKEEEMPYRNLTTYGRHIFRLCLNTILPGAIMAEDANLSSLFVHNQERLQSMCSRLSNRTIDAQERLLSISRDAQDLQQYLIESQ